MGIVKSTKVGQFLMARFEQHRGDEELRKGNYSRAAAAYERSRLNNEALEDKASARIVEDSSRVARSHIPGGGSDYYSDSEVTSSSRDDGSCCPSTTKRKRCC